MLRGEPAGMHFIVLCAPCLSCACDKYALILFYYIFDLKIIHVSGDLNTVPCSFFQRDYQKEYNINKIKNHIPADIIPNVVAKRSQDMLSDVLYRTYLHNWTCHPEQEDAIRARKNNEILSDVRFKFNRF